MKISLLNAKSVARSLAKLIEEHDQISMAVAWGGIQPVAETLLANKPKFASVLLGVDFRATDPNLLKRLADVPNAYVAKNRPGCFHPKVFYFESGARAEAIVGSANFTPGGLGSNFEASVHAKGAASEPFFKQVRDLLASYKHLHLPITKELADGYRRQCEAGGIPQRPKNPVLPGERKEWARLDSELATMSWSEFARRAREDRYHAFGKRLKLLRAIRQMFLKVASVTELSDAEWKGVAGVLGDGEAETEELDDLAWGWFGSMNAAGSFAKLIGRRSAALAHGIDGIPIRGEVSEADFDRYVEAFTRAFARSSRTGRVAPATRLLAMKRPDVFICVNGGNQGGLAKALAYAPTTLSLDNYWERVIEPVRQSPWYKAPRPARRNVELWDARAAMVDAIYYEPKTKQQAKG